MAIGPIITRGFGTFGSVNLIPTRGYLAGAAVVPTVPGLEYTLKDSKMHYTLPDNRLHYDFKDEDNG